MDDQKIASLTVEAQALQAILTNILLQLGQSDPTLQRAIKRGFDDAAEFVTRGAEARPERVFTTLRFMDDIRAASIAD